MSGEEREPCSLDLAARTRHGRDREPHAMVGIPEDLRFVLEVVERVQPLCAEGVGEEWGGGFVGRQAGGGEDAGGAGGCGDGAHGFGEDAVGVDVALPGEGIASALE